MGASAQAAPQERCRHADTHGISRGCLLLYGCSQKVRHGTLTPVCAGSTPAARAKIGAPLPQCSKELPCGAGKDCYCSQGVGAGSK